MFELLKKIFNAIISCFSVYGVADFVICVIRDDLHTARESMRISSLDLHPATMGGGLILLTFMVHLCADLLQKNMLNFTSGRRLAYHLVDFIRLTGASVILWSVVKYAVLVHGAGEWWFLLCFTLFCFLSVLSEARHRNFPWEQYKLAYLGKLSGAFFIGVIEFII